MYVLTPDGIKLAVGCGSSRVMQCYVPGYLTTPSSKERAEKGNRLAAGWVVVFN